MEKQGTAFDSLEAEIITVITEKHSFELKKAPTIGEFNPHMGLNQSWFSVQENTNLESVAETIKTFLTAQHSAKVTIVDSDGATFAVVGVCQGKFLRVNLSFDTEQNTMILSMQM